MTNKKIIQAVFLLLYAAPHPKKVQHMNALKTLAEQVEEYGTFVEEQQYNKVTVKRYRMDTVTDALVYITNNKPRQVSFIYSM